MRPEGWQARALSWVLAVFATLAMVGAVATMSTNTPGGMTQSGGGQATRTESPADRSPPRGTTIEEAAPFTTGAPREETRQQATARVQANALKDIAGWLQALTYAVLALVAVTAVGVLALFRIVQAGSDRAA